MHYETDMCEPKTGVQSMIEEELYKYNGCLNNWFMCVYIYKAIRKETEQNKIK